MKSAIPLLLITILFLSACTIKVGSSVERRNFYVLQGAETSFTPSRTIPARLSIRTPRADRFIDSHRVLFSDTPSLRSFYQFAAWIDTPPEYFADLLARSIERAQLFQGVARGVESGSNFVLDLELRDFYHKTTVPPGSVEIVVVAELLQAPSFTSLSRKELRVSVPAESFDAEGAVAAFDKGLGTVFTEILVWLEQVAGGSSDRL